MSWPAQGGDGDAPFSRLFGLDLPHGRCVGVSLPAAAGEGAGEISDEVLARLHEDERRHAVTLKPVRRLTWVGGRLALRAALDDLGIQAGAILQTPRGAPRLPADVTGSISHKERLAVGLAAAGVDGWCVGVDIERVVARHPDLARYVLRPEERERLSPPSDPGYQAAVLAAFSAKEAIYKALDPFVGRMVGFDEVAVRHRDDGTAEVTLHLGAGARARAGDAGPRAPEGPFDVEVAWLRRDDVILSTARVRLRPAA
jgi:4'-phosphopantetheinyl transferase EntD